RIDADPKRRRRRRRREWTGLSLEEGIGISARRADEPPPNCAYALFSGPGNPVDRVRLIRPSLAATACAGRPARAGVRETPTAPPPARSSSPCDSRVRRGLPALLCASLPGTASRSTPRDVPRNR